MKITEVKEYVSQTGSHYRESLMNHSRLLLLVEVTLLLCLAAPATCAIMPLWIEHATVGGELQGVLISTDGSTIITGGDQVISLTSSGRKRWSGWSGTCLDISKDGDYILASKGPVVRLISAAGTIIWDQSMDITVTDLSMAPDASMIVVAGGGKVRTMTFSGESLASNTTMAVNHVKIMPPGDRILFTTNNEVAQSDFSLIPAWSDRSATQNLLAVSGDGSSFVTAADNRVRLYTGNGSLLWDKKFFGGNILALAYSRDGSTIVTGTDANTLRVLRNDGTQMFTANATNWITSVAISDDGNTIAAGSLDKKLIVYNRAGTMLGTFTAGSAIRFNSVAVTGTGSLIVAVDDSAVYGFLRSSFTANETPTGTITVPTADTPREIPTASLPVSATRKDTPRLPTLPTPYPPADETPEASVPPTVPLVALGLLLLGLFRRK